MKRRRQGSPSAERTPVVPADTTKRVAVIVRNVPADVRERIRERAHENYTSMNAWILKTLDRESRAKT